MRDGDLYKCLTNIRAISDIETGSYMSVDKKIFISKLWTLRAPTKDKIIALIEPIFVSSYSEDKVIWIALCEEKFYYLWFEHDILQHLIKLN